MSEFSAPYHLLGLVSMTETLWVFLCVQLAIQVVAIALLFVRAKTPKARQRLVLGNAGALVLCLAASALTVALGFLQSFAAEGPPPQQAAQLASGLLTVFGGVELALPFTVAAGALIWLQNKRSTRAQAPS